jgi:hypothetical protein
MLSTSQKNIKITFCLPWFIDKQYCLIIILKDEKAIYNVQIYSNGENAAISHKAHELFAKLSMNAKTMKYLPNYENPVLKDKTYLIIFLLLCIDLPIYIRDPFIIQLKKLFTEDKNFMKNRLVCEEVYKFLIRSIAPAGVTCNGDDYLKCVQEHEEVIRDLYLKDTTHGGPEITKPDNAALIKKFSERES